MNDSLGSTYHFKRHRIPQPRRDEDFFLIEFVHLIVGVLEAFFQLKHFSDILFCRFHIYLPCRFLLHDSSGLKERFLSLIVLLQKKQGVFGAAESGVKLFGLCMAVIQRHYRTQSFI